MNEEQLIQKKIRIYGIVQGVGFRPTADRHAREAGITGTVSNKGSYVEVLAEGMENEIADFVRRLKEEPPERAVILKIDEKAAGGFHSERQYREFTIIESAKKAGDIFVSPDIAVCDTCKRELFDPADRRYLHPFINCTQCGPRLTILDHLPYDRERTSMKAFPMCPSCDREYHDPSSRRYDAQPVCCHDCGPEVYLYRTKKRKSNDAEEDMHTIGQSLRNGDAICEARRILRSGGIVAVKGIGGFHLSCDASDEDAVRRLRNLKTRPMKPFAVMMRDEAAVERECILTEQQREVLTGHQKPILLLEKKKEGTHLAQSAAPENPSVGVMLPYAPLQLLLFSYPDGESMTDLLVMTSGNVSGAPIAKDDSDADEELSGLCDAVLSNNRDILIRTDDSVMDFYKDEPYMIRRSRGYAPVPFLLSGILKGNVLAVGGELKNTFCLARDNLFYPSSYVGDMEDIRTCDALLESEKRMEDLLETVPSIVAADLHPRYHSAEAAEEIARSRHVPCIRVQHHFAHVLSCMAENDCQEKVIGIAMDGTGFGTDGTIWGGEILLSDTEGFARAASIYPFLQIGGDRSSKEGWRIAVSMIYSLHLRTYNKDRQKAAEKTREICQKLHLTDSSALHVQLMMADHGINSVTSTSCGRLFDAVSAVLGIRTASTFEGEASTALMYRAMEHCPLAACMKGDAELPPVPAGLLLPMKKDGRYLMRTDLLMDAILSEAMTAGDNLAEKRRLAFNFHYFLAEMTAACAAQLAKDTGLQICALSGGVYQNTLLLYLTESALKREGLSVIRHHMIPPNDGGIAIGQALFAMRQLTREQTEGEERAI